MLIHKSMFATCCTSLKIMTYYPSSKLTTWKWPESTISQNGKCCEPSGGKKKNFREVMVVGGLVAKSCPILCNPMDYSPPGFSVYGILQARILGWLPFPSPGDLPDPGIKPTSSVLAGRFCTTKRPGKPNKTRESSYWRYKVFKQVIWLWDQSHLRKYLFLLLNYKRDVLIMFI